MTATATPISATQAITPDWSREDLIPGWWEPGKHLLRTIRRYQAWSTRRGPIAWIARKVLALRYRRWRVASGADIPINAHIGGGLLIPHPIGIVIHPEAEIGPNCLIFQGVTVGTGTGPGLPRIGAGVDIGAGAKLLGPITVGDGAKIGANAVVLSDVPAGATAVGIPARILNGVA